MPTLLPRSVHCYSDWFARPLMGKTPTTIANVFMQLLFIRFCLPEEPVIKSLSRFQRVIMCLLERI